MLRAIILGLVLSVLATACAIFTQPPPAGTRPFQAEILNRLSRPAELTVTTPAGVLPGAVQPASLPAGSTTVVTFHVPPTGDWTIMVNGFPAYPSDLVNRTIGVCTMRIEIRGDRALGMECDPP